MKRLAAVSLLLLLGCDPHADDLAAIDADYTAQLGAKVAVAQSLNERRRHAEALKAWLDDPAPDKGPPPTAAALPAIVPFTPRPLPPKSMFETERSEQARARIAMTERRIKELDRVLAELSKLEEQRLALEAKLPK